MPALSELILECQPARTDSYRIGLNGYFIRSRREDSRTQFCCFAGRELLADRSRFGRHLVRGWGDIVVGTLAMLYWPEMPSIFITLIVFLPFAAGFNVRFVVRRETFDLFLV